MSTNLAWLNEKQMTLPNGETIRWQYDSEGDFLEIFFRQAPASATVELAEGVYLRFDRAAGQALSLGVMSASTLVQQQEFGLPLLALEGLRRLPKMEQQLVLQMLQSSPVNLVLQVYSFRPKTQAKTVPLATLSRSMPLAL